MIDKGKIAALIVEQLDALHEHQLELKESAGTVQLDQSRVGRLSRMDALQTQAMQVETLRRVTGQIRQLQLAQQRIDSEDFGFCDECFEQIANARIEMNPAVRLCINCAEKAEQQSLSVS